MKKLLVFIFVLPLVFSCKSKEPKPDEIILDTVRTDFDSICLQQTSAHCVATVLKK